MLVPGTGEVRIRHCNLSVGRNQDGILLVRVERAQVEDNILTAYTPKKLSMSQRLQDQTFRAAVVRDFISDVVYIKAAQPTKNEAKAATRAKGTAAAKRAAQSKEANPPVITKIPPNVSLTIGNASIAFRTNTLLKGFWETYLKDKGPQTISTNRDLLLFVKKAAQDFLLQPKLREGNSAITTVLSSLERADQISMARGIVVGGEGIQECRILNNSISGAVQGIIVGMSNHKLEPFARDASSVVTIAGNQIYAGFPLGAASHGRQAIFVGNVNSLLIEDNYCKVLNTANQAVDFEGVRVWGLLGYRAIIRQCHFVGFSVPVRFVPLALPPLNQNQKLGGPLWLIADNMAELAPVCVFYSQIVPASVRAMWINNLGTSY